MPDWNAIGSRRQAPAPTPGPNAPTSGIWAGAGRAPVAPELEEEFDAPAPTREGVRTAFYEPPEEEGVSAGQQFGIGGAVAGAGLLLAGLARKNPQMAKDALRKLGSAVNTARYTSMLSGLAPIKSALGNVGAPIVEAAERGTAEPMRQLIKRETLSDWFAALKNPELSREMQGLTGETGATLGKWNLPGRLMGAGDYATQRALQRAGLSAKEAQRATLMSPLHESYGKLGEKLDSPVAETLIPFRRVPFNQFAEGLEALKFKKHQGVTAGALGAGAVAGAATAEEEYPVLPAFVAATAGRYGLPVALAAAIVRFQMGKSGGGIPGSMLPVSEYGFEETLKNPLRPLDPNYWGIVRAHRRLVEGR